LLDLEYFALKENPMKKDIEAVKVIDAAIAGSSSYVEALDRYIKWEKEKRGLIGIHVSLNSFAKYDGSSEEKENIAKAILMMHRGSACGDFEDITSTCL